MHRLSAGICVVLVEVEGCHDSKSVWQKMSSLLHPVTSSSSPHSAGDFNNFFTGKVDAIRAATASAPTIFQRDVPPFPGFGVVTVDKVSRLLRETPSKQCALAPVPTSLVKRMCDVFAPIIAKMVNALFQQGMFPSSHKHAIVHPRIKKPSLDPLDIKSYRPISNLSFISKVVERLAVNRFSDHTSQHNFLPERQSAYRRYHPTETAVTIVYNDIVRYVSALVLLP